MTQNIEPTDAVLSKTVLSKTLMVSEPAAIATSGPAPTSSFARFNLVGHLNDAIVKLGYTLATPIQERAIPILLAGRDVLGVAQTGTGKTAAFALPILNKIMSGKFNGTQALIMVPTRELAQQVCTAISQLAGRSSVKAVTIFGGQSFGMQVKELRSGPDVIVACPGRLLDHVERRTIKLDNVSMLVLDEADQMFDMGFLPTVRQIMKLLPKQRQSMLFSATMPGEIKSLAMEVLNNPETVQVASLETAATIHHKLYGVTHGQKTDFLIKLLKQNAADSVLVFARTKQRTKKVHDALFKGGVSATSLQGNLSQQQRDKSMKGFRAGKFKVMVATDIASRGIDVASIGLVINYDMPLTTETYTHRVGRTGRALRSGTAVTLAGPEDRSMVRLLERRLKVGFEHAVLEGFDRVDLAGGNADEAGAPQFGRRAGGGGRDGSRDNRGARDSRGGGRFGNRGADRGRSDRSSAGRSDERSSSESRPNFADSNARSTAADANRSSNYRGNDSRSSSSFNRPASGGGSERFGGGSSSRDSSAYGNRSSGGERASSGDRAVTGNRASDGNRAYGNSRFSEAPRSSDSRGAGAGSGASRSGGYSRSGPSNYSGGSSGGGRSQGSSYANSGAGFRSDRGSSARGGSDRSSDRGFSRRDDR